MKHPRASRLIVLALLCVFNIFHQAQAQVFTARQNVSMASNTNGFYEYLPEGYDPNGSQTYPVIVFIHGLGELGNGSSQLSSILYHGIPRLINAGQFPKSFSVNGQTFKFIVIAPQFVGWPGAGDVDGVISYISSHYKADMTRIYLTGLSMGGGAVWEYAGGSSTYANRLAAIVPICGASWPDVARSRIMAAANLPVWALHNNADPTVPLSYSTDYVKNINTYPAPNPQAKLTIFQSGSHDAWTQSYDPNFSENYMNVYQWMLQFKKGSAPVTSTPAPVANKAPVANAGADQTITLPTSSIYLNGSASDPDGTVSSAVWSKVSGPGSYGFASAYSAQSNVTGLVQGTYTFRLTVTDNSGAVTSDDVNITVNPLPVVITPTFQAVPGRIEGESYSNMSGVQKENTYDAGGGQDVGYIDNGDWMDYNINVATAGTYTINFRVATESAGGQIQFRKSDGTVLQTLTLPNTNGFQTWKTVSTTINLSAGQQTLRLVSMNSNMWNVNWFEFAASTVISPDPPVTTTPSTGITTTRYEAENYSNMSGVQKEVTLDAGGGQDVGWIDNGDWMDFTVNAPGAGTYTVNFRVATPNNGAQVQLKSASGALLGTANLPNTGGYQNWQTSSVTISLSAGQQTIRLQSSNASLWNINWFELVGPSGPTSTTTPTTPAAPAPTTGTTTRIEAENYTNMLGVQKEVTLDAGGGQDVGWIDNGDWMDFSYNAPSAGTYTVNFRVATPNNGAQLQLKSAAGSVLGTLNLPNTGGYQNWQTASVTVTLAAGQQTIRVASTTANMWNINWLELVGGSSTTTTVPTTPVASTTTRVEAENYTNMLGVQKEVTLDAGGGQDVGWIDNGDWMDFSYNAPVAGTYTINFRVATPNNGAQLQVKSAAGTVLGTLNLPNTGGYQNWQTASVTVTLAAGQQTLRVASTTANMWNINWLELVSPGSASAKLASTSVVSETSLSAGAALELYPNPVSDRFTLTVNNNLTGKVQVDLISSTGVVVKQFSLSKAAAGTTQFYLSIGTLPAGTYVLKASMTNWSDSKNLIKQ